MAKTKAQRTETAVRHAQIDVTEQVEAIRQAIPSLLNHLEHIAQDARFADAASLVRLERLVTAIATAHTTAEGLRLQLSRNERVHDEQARQAPRTIEREDKSPHHVILRSAGATAEVQREGEAWLCSYTDGAGYRSEAPATDLADGIERATRWLNLHAGRR